VKVLNVAEKLKKLSFGYSTEKVISQGLSANDVMLKGGRSKPSMTNCQFVWTEPYKKREESKNPKINISSFMDRP
jgi:hypothetical protein